MLRWAAGHLLRRQRTDLDRLGRRAASLDSHHGPLVIAGALDVADSLSDGDAQRAVDLGLTSGRAQARKVALRVLADRIDPPDAVRRARSDPDASIRSLAPELQAQTDASPSTLF